MTEEEYLTYISNYKQRRKEIKEEIHNLYDSVREDKEDIYGTALTIEYHMKPSERNSLKKSVKEDSIEYRFLNAWILLDKLDKNAKKTEKKYIQEHQGKLLAEFYSVDNVFIDTKDAEKESLAIYSYYDKDGVLGAFAEYNGCKDKEDESSIYLSFIDNNIENCNREKLASLLCNKTCYRRVTTGTKGRWDYAIVFRTNLTIYDKELYDEFIEQAKEYNMYPLRTVKVGTSITYVNTLDN